MKEREERAICSASAATQVLDLSSPLPQALEDTSKDYHLLQDQYPFAASTGVQADSSTHSNHPSLLQRQNSDRHTDAAAEQSCLSALAGRH